MRSATATEAGTAPAVIRLVAVLPRARAEGFFICHGATEFGKERVVALVGLESGCGHWLRARALVW